MRQEIDQLLDATRPQQVEEPEETSEQQRKNKYDEVQRQLNMQFNAGPADHPVSGYIVRDDDEPDIRKASKGGSSK